MIYYKNCRERAWIGWMMNESRRMEYEGRTERLLRREISFRGRVIQAWRS